MGYFIIGAIVLIALMPLAVQNQTKYRQERIAKKAASLGVVLDFAEEKK